MHSDNIAVSSEQVDRCTTSCKVEQGNLYCLSSNLVFGEARDAPDIHNLHARSSQSKEDTSRCLFCCDCVSCSLRAMRGGEDTCAVRLARSVFEAT